MKSILDKKIGIIGGGQLGKMMILEAKKLGFYTVTLDPSENCPSSSISDLNITASFEDKEAFERLSDMCDVITYEFEHINADALIEMQKNNVEIYPSPKSLKIIQNKYTQKSELERAGLLVPKMIEITCFDDLYKAGEIFSYPYMLKSCTGGYDGKGNAVVKDQNSVEIAYNQLGSGKLSLMAEEMINFTMEISVLACRGIDGKVEVYPVGKNVHIDSILDETLVPAPISSEAVEKAMEVAKKVMNVFDGVGIFCVEMFITEGDNIYINEVAPRPHNSGHYTIEACVTSQFEQHIRAITGLPLGSAELIKPACMKNLLGEEGFSGKTVVTGIEEALMVKGSTVHIYGKETTAPKRKMGHVTAIADSVDKAQELAAFSKSKIKIISH
ncbi:MAG: 5-(carboxyamino)imidazole ribonucleotide synthase [Defluviitaleaceae bacterium]|nr:5-(carboxyamino)imidazole ribonucleotide synthase [Defluviitaleaceae bacterium]